jgi:class 3 adenylate cyclase/pimeloyl-ACP methyl ester carboxylesterase
MEQDIRFCKAADGVGIAYAAAGEGYPLLFVHGWASHLEFWTKMPRAEETAYGQLPQHFRFYRYDARGWGLSDRDVSDFSLEKKLLDVEAVVKNAGLERFAIIGVSEGGPTAIAYAVQNPDKVSHLVLLGTFAHTPGPTPEELPILQARMMTIKPGWGKDTPEFRQLWTAMFMPEADMDMIRWFNELQRVSGTAETVMALIGAIPRIDVRDLLPQVKTPTLVAHARGDLACPFEGGRAIASGIPNARFLPLESNNHFLLPGEPANEALLKAMTDFIGEPTTAVTPAQASTPSGLVTILFTDMAGSTAMTQRLGDEGAQDLVRQHNTVVRDALRAHAGNEIKHTGDGIMASFPSARGAVECAVAIQRALAAAGDGVRVRIGLNAGEPVAEEQDLYGTSVQMAARVCAEADAGEILVSNVVRELAAGKGFLFNDRGDRALKGFEDPVRIYEVKWRS